MNLVSVVMPAYNAESTIMDTIDSVLSQTYGDFEFIIINDGSTDGTADIVGKLKDPRIVFVDNQKNMGIIYSLNRGIRLAKNKYIIRVDADDICLPARFEKQVNFMESNPDVAASGTQMSFFGDGEPIRLSAPEGNSILRNFLYRTPVFHPTAIIRKSVLDKYHVVYDSEFTHVEDYKLWSDIMMKSGMRLDNLDERLVSYRLSPNQITRKHKDAIEFNTRRIRIDNIKWVLGKIYPEREFDISSRKGRAEAIKHIISSFGEVVGSYRDLASFVMFILLYNSRDSAITSKEWLKANMLLLKCRDVKSVVTLLLQPAFPGRWDGYRI